MRFPRGTRPARALAAVAAATAAALAGALAIVALPGTANAAVGSGSYTIVNNASGLCLDLPGSSTAAGTQLDLQACSGGANQSWTLTAAASGFTITSPVSGLCLGIAGNSTSAGKAVQQQACAPGAGQEWTPTPVGSSYHLVNVNSGLCVNASSSGTTPGTLIVQNSCDTAATKAWNPTPTTTTTGTATPTPTPSATPTSPSPTPSTTTTPPQQGEPSVPATCTALTATLANPGNEQFTSAQESAPPDTARIQSALNSCAGTGKAVELKASGGSNAFLSGPLTVNASEVLLVDTGVTLFASRNPADYQISGQPKCGTLGASDGSTMGTATGCLPFIAIRGSNSGIMGTQNSSASSQGTINGRGDQDMLGTSTTWWQLAESAHSKTTTQQENPKLITDYGQSNVTMYHISLTQSPMFNVLIDGGSGFTAWGVRIDNPDNARNTDGFDPDSASNVLITNSFINTGDDGVAVKADAGGAASGITVSNTSFWGIHGLSVGSQTNGGVQNVTFSGNYIHGGTDIHGNTASSNNGVRVKSDTSFGGTVTGVSFLNTCETGVEHLILIDPQYLSGNGSTVPNFAGITINGLKAVSSSSGKSTLNGYSASFPLNLTLENVQLDATSVASQYANIKMYNSNITPSGTGVTVTSFTGTGSVPSCSSFPGWPGL